MALLNATYSARPHFQILSLDFIKCVELHPSLKSTGLGLMAQLIISGENLLPSSGMCHLSLQRACKSMAWRLCPLSVHITPTACEGQVFWQESPAAGNTHLSTHIVVSKILGKHKRKWMQHWIWEEQEKREEEERRGERKNRATQISGGLCSPGKVLESQLEAQHGNVFSPAEVAHLANFYWKEIHLVNRMQTLHDKRSMHWIYYICHGVGVGSISSGWGEHRPQWEQCPPVSVMGK